MENYKKYAQTFNASEEVIAWIEHTLTNYLKKEPRDVPIEQVEHIIDYLISPDAPKKNLTAMSYKEALKNSEKWMKSQIKKGEHIKEVEKDVETILDFKDGFRVVKLIGKAAYEREGYLMNHCVASYFGNSKEIYSLRDKENYPHCTMEKDQQIKGKGNGDIHPKYIKYVVAFLEHIGMKVRDSEMAHLGYEVESFPQYCKTPIFRDRYVRKGQKVVYDDKVVVYTDLPTAKNYKGNKVCLYKGDLKITEKNYSLGKIQGVGGYLYIYSNVELKAENLKSIGGDLYISSDVELPNLKSVGGDLSISSKSKVNGLRDEKSIREKIEIKGRVIFR